MKKSVETTIFLCILFTSFAYGSDYYWVGGFGDFSDLSHWATCSGGNNFYTTVPSADDNVFFDANSFSAPGQTVIMTADAVCRDINWTGANLPILYSNGGYNLRIFGSLILIQDMTFRFYGQIFFESAALGNTINMAGHSFLNYVTFRGIGGEWTLLDDLYVPEALFFEAGSLITNSKHIFCSQFLSEFTYPRSLILGNSVITVEGNLKVFSTNLTLDCGNSLIKLKGYNALFSAGDNLTFYKVIFTNDTSNNLILTGNSTYHSVVFLGGGNISGNNTYDSLVFSQGKMYTIAANSTQTINSGWSLDGNCTARITINSSMAGSNCTVLKTSSNITGSYLVLKDVWAGGGAIYIASNSIDQGNNSGWIINAPSTQNLYWVGNGGNWADPAHWSISSGGIGGSCIPSPIDNVFFDQNSFNLPGQKVLINVSDAICNSIDWTGVQKIPELSSTNSDNSLRIYGSLILSMNMIFSFTGKIYFESTQQLNTISTNGRIVLNEVHFSGVGGWELLDNFEVNSNIFFEFGSFSTNHQNVICNGIHVAYSYLSSSGIIDFTSSNIYIKNNVFDFWWLTSQSFNCGTSTIFINGPGANFSSYQTFYRVIFTDSSQQLASLEGGCYKYLSFSCNAIIKGSPNVYDTLILSPGYSYYMVGNHTINNYFGLNGTCMRKIFLSGLLPSAGYQPGHIIASNATISGNNLILDNITATGGASFVANNSIDLGANTGWTINLASSRILYWVNNGGDWNDPGHWSLYSGGLGGECLPTPIDNVVFDINSFNLPDQKVKLTLMKCFCKNMTWTNVQDTPTLTGTLSGSINSLKIYGSLQLDPNMEINTNSYGWIEFSSSDTTNTIYAPLNFQSSLLFTGSGKWELISDLNVTNYIYIYNGSIFTKGFTVSCNLFFAAEFYGLPINIALDSSKVFCDGFRFDSDVNFSCGKSTITTNYYDGNNQSFNRVIFNDNTLHRIWGVQNQFKYVYFKGDGDIDGSNTFDTLTLTSGKTYTISSQTIQNINDQFNIRGNNCYPISLKTSQQGSLASISKPSGTVSGDFLELQDIQATGGASFFAGNFSTDLGNNPGWTWGNSPGYVYGFPTDTTICQGDTLILKTDNFNGGIAFLWQDGSTSPAFTVTQSGTYSCRVTYAENCYIRDSIHVTVNPVPQAAAVPMSQVICSGETCSISLGNINNVPGTSFLWTANLQNGNNTTGFSSGSGDHISQALTNNGTTAATIIYTVTPWFRNCPGAPVNAGVTVKAHASSISGKLKYDNDSGTAISCSKVYLKTLSGMIIDSSTTDHYGMYRFCDVPNGSYKLIATSSRSWGGVNATDAFLALKHFANLGTLTGLRYTAGDVNNTGYINSVDALLMATRYVEMTNSFIIGDWQFEQPEINLTEITNLTIDILGLCTGDVNGSYIPPGCEP